MSRICFLGRISNEFCSCSQPGGNLQVQTKIQSIDTFPGTIYRLILAKGGNFDLQDTNGCTVTHIMVVFDNIKVVLLHRVIYMQFKVFNFQMFDMATECGAAINIENNQGLTPLTTAAYLARMDMFFHIANIEREIYWQIGNVTCSAYPLK